MSGFEMFCERCGQRYGSDEASSPESLPLAQRLMRAVGRAPSTPRPPADEPFLRFCLACRGYSCPACWNDDAGFCQTCVPLPEIYQPAFAVPAAVEPAAVQPLAVEAFDAEPTAVESLVAEPAAVQPVAVEAFDAEPMAVESLVAEPVAVEAFDAEPMAAEAFDAEPMAVDSLVAEPAAVEPVAIEPVEAEIVAVEPAAVAAVAPEPGAGEAFDAQPVAVETVAVEAFDAEIVAAEPLVFEPAMSMAEPEPPLPEPSFDELDFAEPEPDVQWDWTFEPLDEPDVSVADSEVASAPAATPVVEPSPRPASPHPVFRPLEPIGPIVPPPPPATARPSPRIEFDLPSAPPAFVIARAPNVPAARPVLPAGLFEGPGPAIRPCSNCDLPVSARARFCRRCGSAQSASA